ncbi:MAG: AmmeMemoRadiSam system radical SAM enzyme [Candidatus ainarchaeum sp.]|nr:AmmeMemoRadiSam system radical SAM enzyme [Candidatus ainarchaeum sp.]
MENVLFEKKDGFVECKVCNHYCKIRENSYGFCGVRKNVNRKIVLMNYAKPVSLCLDPIEKKPLYHYLPGSNTFSIGFFGCNFKCDFCQNYDISTTKGLEVEKSLSKLEKISPKNFVELALKKNAKSIAFTYNEPTISIEYCLEAMEEAKKRGLGTVFVSNGYASKESVGLLKGKLDAINIDLKSFNPIFYKKVCGAELEKVLETIKLFKKIGVWVELTTLIIPTKNDSKEELKEIASFIKSVGKEIPWHVSAFTPMYKMSNLQRTNIEKIEEAIKIGKEMGLQYVYSGNCHSDNENTFCKKCNSLLIKRSYYDVKVIGLKKNKCLNCGEKLEGIFE